MEQSNNSPKISVTEEQMSSDSAFVGSMMAYIPIYQEEFPQAWFTLLEGHFKMRCITSQETKFDILQFHLPPHILKKASDVIGNIPKENAYDILKREILAQSEEAQFRKLLSYPRLGNQRPSELLHQMQILAHNLGMNDSILYRFWSAALPGNIRAALALQPKDIPLNSLADLADRVHECFTSPGVHQVSRSATGIASDVDGDLATQILQRLDALELKTKTDRRSRARLRSRQGSNTRSHSKGICYYHRHFGENARKCVIPCSYNDLKGASRNALVRQ